MNQHLPTILLIDDDVELSAMLSEYLSAEGFVIDVAVNGVDGVERALSRRYDAVILDVMLPQLNGIEVLREVRKSSQIPILMLTAKGDRVDRVIGLELGADDYVAKPYYGREVVARLRAILRRSRTAPESTVKCLRIGGLEIHVAARRSQWRGKEIELTATEFNVLVALAHAGDDVATKDMLSEQVLGRIRRSYDRSVDVHVSKLRLKLDHCSQGSLTIETVRGVGYRMSYRE